MALVTPAITYESIKINGADITMHSSTCRASFVAPYNKIDFKIKPTNCSISYYEIRVTRLNDDFGIGRGKLAYWTTSLAINTSVTFSMNINDTNFIYGDGSYRIGLYARSSVDGSWDATYLYFTSGNEKFVPKGSDAYEVLTIEAIPS